MSASLRILSETRVDIDQARRRLGTDDRPVHHTTVYRLMSRGLQAPSGERVVLESVRVGLRRITSIEAIERFIAVTNGLDLDGPGAVESSPARSKRRQKDLAGVDRYLDSVGIR
jgi:hypothetical protein